MIWSNTSPWHFKPHFIGKHFWTGKVDVTRPDAHALRLYKYAGVGDHDFGYRSARFGNPRAPNQWQIGDIIKPSGYVYRKGAHTSNAEESKVVTSTETTSTTVRSSATVHEVRKGLDLAKNGGSGSDTDYEDDDSGDESIYVSCGEHSKRNIVLAELAETEKNYVDILNVLIDKFQRPLLARKALSQSDAKTIFLNISELLAVHTKLLAGIQQAMASTTGRHVSRPILNHVEAMRCYGQFCCGIPTAMKKLRAMDKGSFMKALEKARTESGQRFHLIDLLNVPMQRVLKYPLLMKELIKATPDDHKDTQGLVHAKAAVDDLARYVSTTKQEHDNLTDMIASLEKYNGPPLQQYAPFVKDGDVMYKDAKATKGDTQKLTLRYAFLLNKAIVLTKPRKTKYVFQGPLLELKQSWSIADVPFGTLGKEEQHSKYSFAWAIKEGADTLHVFCARTLYGKRKWMAALNKCLGTPKDEALLGSSLDPELAADRSPPGKTLSESTKAALQGLETPRSAIQLHAKLGAGQFGDVWRGTLQGTTEVAIKTQRPGTALGTEEFMWEARHMNALPGQHPSVLQLLAVCTVEEPFYIVMELMPHGSLLDYLHAKGRSLLHSQRLHLCKQVAAGMVYIGASRLLHRSK